MKQFTLTITTKYSISAPSQQDVISAARGAVPVIAMLLPDKEIEDPYVRKEFEAEEMTINCRQVYTIDDPSKPLPF